MRQSIHFNFTDPPRLLAVICILMLSFLCYWFTTEDYDSSSLKQDTSRRGQLLYFKGISSTSNMGGNFVFKFEADELKMVPKKFYIFNIKSFNEAHFNNARFTTNLRHGNEVGNGDKSKYFSDFTLPPNIFRPNSTVGLTDVTIKGFEWVVVKRDETIFRAVAKKAFLDKQKSNIKMTDIKIEYPLEGRSITAGSASLSTKAKNIAIPGAFIEQSISGTKTGRGIVLDVDFDQSHFNH